MRLNLPSAPANEKRSPYTLHGERRVTHHTSRQLFANFGTFAGKTADRISVTSKLTANAISPI